MSVQMVQQRLKNYAVATQLEEEHAIREITQEIILAALGRTDFFREASFHGGTCLRIFHGLNRFSEDLDFALQAPDATFRLEPYLKSVCEELAAYGYSFEIQSPAQSGQTVKKAFLKDDSLGRLLTLNYRPATGPLRKIRVKIEVDTNPPNGAEQEIRYQDFPFVSAVSVFDLPSLFSGKLHALICRVYIKGRDWYDFLWYTAQRIQPNYRLLASALEQTGHRANTAPLNSEECVMLLTEKINTIDWDTVRADVEPFVKPNELPSLNLWNRDLFLAQCRKLVQIQE
jgi:predicted nucleotidyltransferase component of viral defense system